MAEPKYRWAATNAEWEAGLMVTYHCAGSRLDGALGSVVCTEGPYVRWLPLEESKRNTRFRNASSEKKGSWLCYPERLRKVTTIWEYAVGWAANANA